jgi:hypothetical protein
LRRLLTSSWFSSVKVGGRSLSALHRRQGCMLCQPLVLSGLQKRCLCGPPLRLLACANKQPNSNGIMSCQPSAAASHSGTVEPMPMVAMMAMRTP